VLENGVAGYVCARTSKGRAASQPQLESGPCAGCLYSFRKKYAAPPLDLEGVVGRLDDPRPHVAPRAGAYGYFPPLPWTSVFDGDPASVDDVCAGHENPWAEQSPLEGFAS